MPSGPLFLQKIERAPCILHVAALWNSGASVRLEPAVVYYILRNTSVQSLDHSHIIYFLITYIKQRKYPGHPEEVVGLEVLGCHRVLRMDSIRGKQANGSSLS